MQTGHLGDRSGGNYNEPFGLNVSIVSGGEQQPRTTLLSGGARYRELTYISMATATAHLPAGRGDTAVESGRENPFCLDPYSLARRSQHRDGRVIFSTGPCT